MYCTAFPTSIHPESRNAADMTVIFAHGFYSLSTANCQIYSVVNQPWARLPLHCSEGLGDKKEDLTLQHVINLCFWLKLGPRGGITHKCVCVCFLDVFSRVLVCVIVCIPGLTGSLPCSADYGPWRFISLSFFSSGCFSLWLTVVQGQSKTLVRLSGEQSAL